VGRVVGLCVDRGIDARRIRMRRIHGGVMLRRCTVISATGSDGKSSERQSQ
jgi:hypothetical protein